MIKKFLVCSKQIYMSSKLSTEYDDYMSSKRSTEYDDNLPPIIEISMPIDTFWEVRDLIQKADYLISANGDPAMIQELYKKVYKKLAPFAVAEADRDTLYGKSK